MNNCGLYLMIYSNEKARQVLTLFTNEQLTELKQRVYKGGHINNSSNRNGKRG